MNSFKTIVIGFLAGLAGAYAFFLFSGNKISEIQPQNIPAADYTSSSTYQPNISSVPSVTPADNNIDLVWRLQKQLPA